ncbi:hypothetical protein GOP80_08920 [Planococcaceae bacterium Storch 2/2-2]|nr:hypothetical protein [Planococcaceae bacterium Storch 2/2-2]
MNDTFSSIHRALFDYLEGESDRSVFDPAIQAIAKAHNVTTYEVYAQLAQLAADDYLEEVFFIDNIPYSLLTTSVTEKGKAYSDSLRND